MSLLITIQLHHFVNNIPIEYISKILESCLELRGYR